MELFIIIILALALFSFAFWAYILKKETDLKNKEILELSAKAAVFETENKNLSALNSKQDADLSAALSDNTALKEELNAFKTKEAELKAIKANLEDNIARQQTTFDKLQSSAKDNFKQLADEVFKVKIGELKTESKEIVAPLNMNLEKLQDKLSKMENLNENLQKEASNLAKALQFNNKTQGNFGEMVLEEVLKACGLESGINYEMQVTLRKEDESKPFRPDCIINLPDERYIVIDSKMSLTAYTKFVAEEDKAQKAIYLQEHINSLEKHIKELSEKKYQELKGIKGRTPDFVLMFVPIEYAYMTALDAKRDLGIFAAGKRIAVVTASSLIPIIKTIESLWRISTIRKEMDKIVDLGKKIHSQSVGFLKEMDSVKSSIDKAGEYLGKSMTKLKGRKGILGYAKQLEELGIKSDKTLPDIPPSLPNNNDTLEENSNLNED